MEYINWYDCEDNLLYGEDTFRSGERYKVEIKIVPTQISCVNAAQFVSPVKAYIDGQQVEERLNWDAVYSNANAVYVYYTFVRAAPAPEVEVYTFVTQPQGGTLAAGVVHNASWQTSFVPDKTGIEWWDGEDWWQIDLLYPTTTQGSFGFESGDPGVYRFRIVAYVGDEAVATSNVFTVTWALPGDADGDGEVTAADAASILQHIAGWSVTVDTAVADVDGDGEITAADAATILQYIAGWNVTLG